MEWYLLGNTGWVTSPLELELLPHTIPSGGTGILDVWIYLSNEEPEQRSIFADAAWLSVSSDAGQWTIPIIVSRISFSIQGNELLKSESCLHNPGTFKISTYAQYAAGAMEPGLWPVNSGDPDTPEQATRNLIVQVRKDFRWDNAGKRWARDPDLTLLEKPGKTIGVCKHYSDLTIGLLRSLGIPARFVDGQIKEWAWPKHGGYLPHAWVEVYLGGSGWEHVDPSRPVAFDKGLYENVLGWIVKSAWADKYPLSSSSIFVAPRYQCISDCYLQPEDCPSCRAKSRWLAVPEDVLITPELCVEDVMGDYDVVKTTALATGQSGGESLEARLLSPTFVTRTVPFTLTSSIVNSTTLALPVITTTVAVSADMSSPIKILDVHPSYQVVNSTGPGEVVTVTWVVTSLVAGSGIPLRVVAESGDLFGMDEHPLVVNEPGTLPDLTLVGVCGVGDVSPGEAVSLSVYVMDEHLAVLTDTSTLVSATVYATPTVAFSKTISLPYCASCGRHESSVTIPLTAPVGSYRVDFVAARAGYDPDRETSYLFVKPSLALTVTASHTSVRMQDTVTLTAQVADRNETLSQAGVWATFGTAGAGVALPLIPDGNGLYTLSFRPVDLAGYGAQIAPGTWTVRVTADYLGGEAVVDKDFTVWGSVYLPVVLRYYH